MMKMIKCRYPKYFKDFKCIGGICSDSCCIGWDIDIDKKSYDQYMKIDNNDIKNDFDKYIIHNDNMIGENIDYCKVKLTEDKRCAFLDKCNYCMIFSEIGEEHLSNVCTFFPRVMNEVDGNVEVSLDTACPEAARMILLDKEGIDIEEGTLEFSKYIVSSKIDSNNPDHKGTAAMCFKQIRDKSIDILRSKGISSLDKRMKKLGEFISGIDDQLLFNYDNLSKFVEEFEVPGQAKGCNDESLIIDDEYCLDGIIDLNSLIGNNDMVYKIRANFLRKMVKFIRVETDVESDSFKKYTRSLIKTFNLDDENFIENNGDNIIESLKLFDDIIKEKEYILENYLVNFIYNNMFPYSENDNIFDGYIMLLMRYSLIKFYLASMIDENKELNDNDIVSFIQSFSKTIEHHKTYLSDSLNYIVSNEFDNMGFASSFI